MGFINKSASLPAYEHESLVCLKMPLARSALAIRTVLWDWFGVLFGATLGWQSVRKDGAAYSHFGRVFYCDTTEHIDTAQKELMAAESLMDVCNRRFLSTSCSIRGGTQRRSCLDHAGVLASDQRVRA